MSAVAADRMLRFSTDILEQLSRGYTVSVLVAEEGGREYILEGALIPGLNSAPITDPPNSSPTLFATTESSQLGRVHTN